MVVDLVRAAVGACLAPARHPGRGLELARTRAPLAELEQWGRVKVGHPHRMAGYVRIAGMAEEQVTVGIDAP